MTKKRPTEKEQFPYVVRLPKGSESPTGSIYKMYDIVKQGMVLNSYPNTTKRSGRSLTLRSSRPFIVSVMVKGKVKQIASKSGK